MTTAKTFDLSTALNLPTESSAESKSNKPKDNLWINIGLYVTIDGEKVFVTFPFNLPIEHMQLATVPAKKSPYQTLQLLKNQLLAKTQAKGAELKPGESIELTGLTCRLTRNATPDVASESELPVLNINW